MGGVVAIVLAAGGGERLGSDLPKAFVPLAGRPLLEHAAAAAAGCDAIDTVLAVVPQGWEERASELLGSIGPHTIVVGGPTRQDSVRRALEAVPADAQVLVCHDAARPFAMPALFDAVIDALGPCDGVVPVLAVTDTVKRVRDGVVSGTEPRAGLGLAQTPQAFLASALRDAHERAEREGADVTDDAMALERCGYRVHVVEGDPRNFKITTEADLARAELIVAELTRE